MSLYIDGLQSLKEVGLMSLRRRWKLIGACIMISMVLSFFVIALKPVSYTAYVQLLIYVREVQPGPELVVSLGRADLTQVENEIEIIRSRGTLARVVRSLKLADDPEFAPVVTPLRRIAQWISGGTWTASDESRSRQDIAVESLRRNIAIKRVGTSHTILVDVTTSDPKKSERIATGISQAVLQAPEQDGNKSPLLRERLQGLGPNAYVITPALAPDKPSGPRKILVILGAIVAGFVVGSMLALLLDFKDKTIRSVAQLEHFGLECIGAIPLLKPRMPAFQSSSRSESDWNGEDEFLPDPLLKQTLLRMTAAIEASGVRTVGIASSVAGEGATTVARQLAQMAARGQRKVLLVEGGGGDPRRFLTATKSFGAAVFVDARQRSREGSFRNGDGGDLEGPATAPDNIDGTASRRMSGEQTPFAAYDLIVISLPPLERGPEFRMAAHNLDGILLVVRWGGAEVERVERAFAVARALPSDFIGAVLNMLDDRLIGQFGDKLWKAEAALAVRRHTFGSVLPVESVTG